MSVRTKLPVLLAGFLLSSVATAAVRASASQVADLYRGAGGSYPGEKAYVNGTLYFTAHTDLGWELWKTNGTRQTTALVADLNPGVGDSLPTGLTPVGNLLYFLADVANFGFCDGTNIVSTDGTPAGTKCVGTVSDTYTHWWSFTALGDTLYFFQYGDLYRANAAGVSRVKELPVGGTLPSSLTAMGGKLYFVADDPTYGRELWSSDGTENGTSMVLDLNSGSASSSPSWLTVLGTRLYFFADDGISGYEFWSTDGTFFGTQQVADIYPGSSGSHPTYLTATASSLYFFAIDDTSNSFALWTSNGTSAGTVKVKQVSSSGLTAGADGLFFFVGRSSPSDYGLWRSDGTPDGTFALTAQLQPSTPFSGVGQPVGFGRFAFFSADDGVHGYELWVSDGTVAGTRMVSDIYKGSTGSGPIWLEPAGSVLYFTAADPKYGSELWQATVR